MRNDCIYVPQQLQRDLQLWPSRQVLPATQRVARQPYVSQVLRDHFLIFVILWLKPWIALAFQTWYVYIYIYLYIYIHMCSYMFIYLYMYTKIHICSCIYIGV